MPRFPSLAHHMPSKLATRRSSIHGNGMFAIAPIAKG
jgi:hypothetical protein